MTFRLSSLSLRQKVGQLFFIGIPGTGIDPPTRVLLDEVSPGGVCLFARNIREASQTRDLLDELRESLPLTPLLSVDQEGGRVDRLRKIMSPMPAANRLRTTEDAAELGAIIGETLRLLGFNMDFAPVVDVIDDERAAHPNGLFSREFGRSRDDVTTLAAAFLDALQAQCIIGCLKHFPGLGAAKVDSHEELPEVSISDEELSSTDLFPYRELLRGGRAKAVMVAHATFPNANLQEIGQNGKLLPSSLSYNLITTLLRERLDFDGLVITDDLEMGAIVKNYGIGEASTMALGAGADMLAICADPDAIRSAYNAVLAAVEAGEIGHDRLEASLGRVSKLKADISGPIDFKTDGIDELSQRTAALSDYLAKN